jgi:hypothetical protein
MTDAATPETATAPEDTTLAAAAAAIERLEDRRRRAEAPAGETDPAEAADPSPDDEQSAEADAETAETDGAEAAGDEPRYAVKVDGERFEVPLRELIQGYQRGSDYTRKTMRLAEERRELGKLRADAEAERAAAAEERQRVAAQAAGAIPTLQAQLAAFAGLDWAQLAAQQPAVHAQARALYESLAQQLQGAELAQAEAAAAATIEQQRTAAEQRGFIAAEKRTLTDRVPEMADPVQGPREAAALARYLGEAGYRAAEIARLVDHRDFILARKAMLYDRLMAGAAKGRQKLAAARVQAPGAAPERRGGAGERRASLMKRLSRSGSTEDAAKLIETML